MKPNNEPQVVPVIGHCAHSNEQTSTGPTTDQVNHWCPDCRTAWTTWPERTVGVPVVAPAQQSERIPCSRCTSEIWCEMNGCKSPRTAGVLASHIDQGEKP